MEIRKGQIKRSDKLIVLKAVASIAPSLPTSLTDDSTTIKKQSINKGKFRRILVFSASPLCLSLSVVRRLSSVTIPSNRAEVLDDKRQDRVDSCIFDVLSLTSFLPFLFVYRSRSAGRRNGRG